MKVIIRERAADDVDRIYSWIARDNPRAASEIVARIRQRIKQLELNSLTYMGRPGLVEGTRELVALPYIIVYSVDEERHEISVLAIFHEAQARRPNDIGQE